MKNKNQLQQGDVTLLKIQSLPPGEAKVLARQRCVLAEGEATGHAHVLEDDDAELIAIGEKIILRLERAGIVKHEEHKPIALEPGLYQIGRIQEYDYLSQMARPVAD